MIRRFLHITLLVVIFITLTLTGKIVMADSCDNFKTSEKQLEVSLNNLDLSNSGSMDCTDCNCHCHHGHLDLVFLPQSLNSPSIEIANNDFDYILPLSNQISSQKKPPKLLS